MGKTPDDIYDEVDEVNKSLKAFADRYKIDKEADAGKLEKAFAELGTAREENKKLSDRVDKLLKKIEDRELLEQKHAEERAEQERLDQEENERLEREGPLVKINKGKMSQLTQEEDKQE
jgi:hypothetical protein